MEEGNKKWQWRMTEWLNTIMQTHSDVIEPDHSYIIIRVLKILAMHAKEFSNLSVSIEQNRSRYKIVVWGWQDVIDIGMWHDVFTSKGFSGRDVFTGWSEELQTTVKQIHIYKKDLLGAK